MNGMPKCFARCLPKTVARLDAANGHLQLPQTNCVLFWPSTQLSSHAAPTVNQMLLANLAQPFAYVVLGDDEAGLLLPRLPFMSVAV